MYQCDVTSPCKYDTNTKDQSGTNTKQSDEISAPYQCDSPLANTRLWCLSWLSVTKEIPVVNKTNTFKSNQSAVFKLGVEVLVSLVAINDQSTTRSCPHSVLPSSFDNTVTFNLYLYSICTASAQEARHGNARNALCFQSSRQMRHFLLLAGSPEVQIQIRMMGKEIPVGNKTNTFKSNQSAVSELEVVNVLVI